jgi:rhodanese-related sulfurtransferase
MKKIFLTLHLFTACIFVSCGQKNIPANTAVVTPQQNIQMLTPAAFQEAIAKHKGILIDVRTPGEYQKGHIKDARLLNIFDDNFETEINKLDKNETYYVYCASGGRSDECVQMMKQKGFMNVYDLDGGIGRWQKEGLPIVQ